MFRDVFVCRLVIVVKRSNLGSCTLDNGTAVSYPNCGQRVADDHARVPKSAGCFFFAAFAPRLQNQWGCPTCSSPSSCFAAWCRARFHRRLWSEARLACMAMRLIVIDRSCANYRACCLPATPGRSHDIPKQHHPSVEDSCRRHIGTRCIRCR